ncbi:MerR family transcriptional regulator [Lacticaseibacillus paracasei]
MAEIADLRTRSVLPIGTVMLLTDLTARQIRYYEAQGLVQPARNAGNHRTYSLNNVNELLEIRSQMADGFTLADVKRLKHPRYHEDSDAEVRQVLRDELLNQSRLNQSPDPGPAIGFRQSH